MFVGIREQQFIVCKLNSLTPASVVDLLHAIMIRSTARRSAYCQRVTRLTNICFIASTPQFVHKNAIEAKYKKHFQPGDSLTTNCKAAHDHHQLDYKFAVAVRTLLAALLLWQVSRNHSGRTLQVGPAIALFVCWYFDCTIPRLLVLDTAYFYLWIGHFNWEIR